MKCGISGCPGEIEQRLIVHVLTRNLNVLVFENVPVEVCGVCSDTLLAPETIRHIEVLLEQRIAPKTQVPLYAYS